MHPEIFQIITLYYEKGFQSGINSGAYCLWSFMQECDDL